MAIWSKGGDEADALVHAFTVGDDYLKDRELAPYDLLGSIAHARMLGAAGIVPAADADALVAGLRALHREYLDGGWTVGTEDEDVHSKVEDLLTARCGDVGKRLHTGRSRNDQVLTAIRLWQKDRLADCAAATCTLADALLGQARRGEATPLPGYTHLQRGMPSSVGMFFAAHAQALCEDLILVDAAWRLADRCPLGSAASYGSGLPIDRAAPAEDLGFARHGGVALADANARGKVETATLDALGAVLGDCARLAADVIFFASRECGFLRLDEGFTTGSSIMPQKRNPDVFELIRGRSARFLGLRTALATATHGLTSGYHRDLQDTKALCFDAVALARQVLAVAGAAVPALAVDEDRILAALTPELYATDEAYRLVREEGWTFRDAYRHVGTHLDELATPDHGAVLASRTHAGSTGNLGCDKIATEIETLRGDWRDRREALHGKWEALLAG